MCYDFVKNKREGLFMKKLFQIITLILAFTVAVSLFGCMAPSDGFGGGYGGAMGPEGAYGDYDKIEDGATEGDKNMGAGMMTASAHNDNEYYALWQDLFYKGQGENDYGKFYNYKDRWGLDSLNRVKVNVTCGGKPSVGAMVSLMDGDTTVFTGVTDSNGTAYLFGTGDDCTVYAKSGQYEGSVSYNGGDVKISLDGGRERSDTIEIMFVVDVTGSMGDEIDYLKNELKDVVEKIAATDGVKAINMAFLFYRDHTDEDVFIYNDFLDVTDQKNLSQHQKNLNKQYANGGGDYPEAVDEALAMATEKQWSQSSTKIIFHVYDAPPHEGNKYAENYSKAVLRAAEKGIRICPILASGADTLCEYLAREAAVLTGGTFVYITDDSGIGNPHYDPNIPNAVVENLNLLMVRLVKGYFTGTFDPPVAWDGNTYYSIKAPYEYDDFILSGHVKKYKQGQTVTIRTKTSEKKVVMYANGQFAGEQSGQGTFDEATNSYYWEFSFIMPDEEVEITFSFGDMQIIE